jgi:GNAT superfamily N-acetyltransferase
VPPLPGEEADASKGRRWVLLDRNVPVGRIAAFAPAHRPGIGYFGFFESPDNSAAARTLLAAAEEWLQSQGCVTGFGPIAGTPRDRIGLLIEAFERPAVLFTPYNPPYYRNLLETAGWEAEIFLRAYGWERRFSDPRGVRALAEQVETDSTVRIRSLRLAHLADETRLIASLINETLSSAWHFDPINDDEAGEMARLLRPFLDPSLALVAEDDAGPCGVALGVPDINWLWHKAGGRLWPLGWAHLLRWRRRIPQVRIMALGLAGRVQRSGLAARLIGRLIDAGIRRGLAYGELSQVYEDNVAMRRILDRMGFPAVRRYAVFSRRLEAG